MMPRTDEDLARDFLIEHVEATTSRVGYRSEIIRETVRKCIHDYGFRAASDAVADLADHWIEVAESLRSMASAVEMAGTTPASEIDAIRQRVGELEQDARHLRQTMLEIMRES